MRSRSLLRCNVAVAVCLFATGLADEKADQILKDVAAFHKKAKTAHVTLANNVELFSAPAELYWSRPNKLIVKQTGSYGDAQLVCDSSKMYSVVGQRGAYAEEKCPASLDPVIDTPMVMFMPNINLVISLFAADPYDALMRGVREARFIGEEDIDGVAVNHIRLDTEGEEAGYDLWFATGTEPVLKRITPDLGPDVKPSQNTPATATLECGEWTLNKGIPPDKLKFAPPANFQKVASFNEILGRPKHALEGKPAPDFTLDLLDGSKVKLSKHKGQDVVILDFWSSEVPPCHQSVPIVAAVGKKYARRGVVLYSVNERQNADTIKAFMEQLKLDHPVALDPTGRVGTSFGANAFPHTAIIDDKGVIRVIFIGLTPDYKRELSREIEKILREKKPKPPSASASAPAPAPAPATAPTAPAKTAK